MLDIEPIKARCEKATGGPWKYGGPVNRDKIIKASSSPPRPGVYQCGDLNSMPEEYFEIGEDDPHAVPPAYACAGKEPDASFISHARTDIPNLIAEIERLRETCKALGAFPVPLRHTTIDGIHVAEFQWFNSTVVYVDHKLTEDVYDHAVEKLEASVD